MKLFIYILTVFAAFPLNVATLAGPLKLDKIQYRNQPGARGTLETIVALDVKSVISADGKDKATSRIHIIYPGTIKAFDGKNILLNRNDTLGVIHFSPVTDVSQVYLLMGTQRGGIAILSDFNERVGRLCAAQGKHIDESYFHVVKIDNNLLTIIAGRSNFGEDVYRVEIKASFPGSLDFVSCRKTLD